ncbi:MAG TPA: TIGR00303 family protein [Methanomicrobiales archaeon]|nr:TIGR00303 family protein [Methanomicrobiales archaeon]
MQFLSSKPPFKVNKPLFSVILANTLLSTVPGISGAGPSPMKTVFTPILDSELILNGRITSSKHKPNTPTGCPTPAIITRSMMEMTGLDPLFINAGLTSTPTVPCLDLYGAPGQDPRSGDAVLEIQELYARGKWTGRLLSRCSDLLVLGECVPGGTTTALCVLRGFGYEARVSSSFISNPVGLKEEVCRAVVERLSSIPDREPLDVVRCGGDPMIAVAAGIASTYDGDLVLAGGTQMLAVAAVLKAMEKELPPIATTVYVRDDPTATFAKTAADLGVTTYYVDPEFGDLGHPGLARYCIGEVKEGIGAGGAMMLAHLMGHSPEEIRKKILAVAGGYT